MQDKLDRCLARAAERRLHLSLSLAAIIKRTDSFLSAEIDDEMVALSIEQRHLLWVEPSGVGDLDSARKFDPDPWSSCNVAYGIPSGS